MEDADIQNKKNGVFNNFPLLLFLFSFSLRLLFILIFPIENLKSDPAKYFERAITLIETGKYADFPGNLTAYEPPGAAIFAIPPLLISKSILLTEIYFSLISCVIVVLTYLLFRKGKIGEKRSRVAAIAFGFIPAILFFGNVPNADTPFLLMSLLAILSTPRDGNILRWVFTGALIGCSILIKPLGFFLIIPCAFFALFNNDSKRKTFIGTAVALIVSLLIFAPWIIRNYSQLSYVGLAANSGVNLFIGNNPSATGGYISFDSPLDTLPEIERDKQFKKLALNWISENRVKAISLLPRKFLFLWAFDFSWAFWINSTNCDLRFFTASFGQVYWISLLLFFSLGLLKFKNYRNDPVFILSLIAVTGVSLYYLPFFGGDRFHIPAIWGIVYIAFSNAFSNETGLFKKPKKRIV